MYILSVIPIQRGIPFNTLSYYHTDALSIGTLIDIPLGKQVITGFVYECTSLIEAKTSIKQATFSLKRIKGVRGTSTYSTALVEGLREASGKTLTPIGSLAGSVLNELFFDLLQDISKEGVPPEEEPLPELSYGTRLERIDTYKRIIRSAFAAKKSVVLVAPSIRSVEYWYTTLQKGISSHTLMLHSKRTKRDQKSILTTIRTSDRPLLICTTPQSALIPRPDISTLIIEDEASPLYMLRDRYNADMRTVLTCIANAARIRLVYGDTLPRFETMEYAGLSQMPRAFTPEHLLVVPTEPYRTLLPSETIELIRYCQKNKKSLFLYTNRKGIAPLSRCADCGTVVECPTCKLPVVLRHKLTGGIRERLFMCTHCGDTLPPTHLCSYCGSWNITPVSIGTESIRDAVASIVPDEHIITVDDDLTPDAKEIETLLTHIQKQKWYIMIGTQKLLPYIKQVDFIALPFFDRILSTPSPYTVEESLRLIMECNEKTKDTLIICTKTPEFPITKLLATKKIGEIISSDIETRRALSYPPFGTILKLSITVPSAHRESVSQKVAYFFEGVECTALPVRKISPDSMKLLCVWIIQVHNDYTTDYNEELTLFLQDLRFPYTMDINPARLS